MVQTLNSVMKLRTPGRKSEMQCMRGLGSWGQGQVKYKAECPGESTCERKLWVTARYRHTCKREVLKSYIAFTRKRERISGFQEVTGKHQVEQILCMLPKTYRFWEFLMHIFMTDLPKTITLSSQNSATSGSLEIYWWFLKAWGYWWCSIFFSAKMYHWMGSGCLPVYGRLKQN